jgi:hypothetical protein
MSSKIVDNSGSLQKNGIQNAMQLRELFENSTPRPEMPERSIISKPANLGRVASVLRASTKAGARTAPFPLQNPHDRSTLPLPANWTKQHDKAICILDVKNYSLPAMIIKLRCTFPSLQGTLTPAMIDKRLQQLDQNVELDYYRAGLQKNNRPDRTKLALPPLPPSPLALERSAKRAWQASSRRAPPIVRKSDETVRLAEVGRPVLRVRLTRNSNLERL